MSEIFSSLLNGLCAVFIGASFTMGAVLIIMLMALGTLKVVNGIFSKIKKSWWNYE